MNLRRALLSAALTALLLMAIWLPASASPFPRCSCQRPRPTPMGASCTRFSRGYLHSHRQRNGITEQQLRLFNSGQMRHVRTQQGTSCS
jgi:hypothetical protein